MSRLEAILTTAAAQIGDWYRYGAEGPDVFDCSGLTQYSYAAGGISLPRTAREQQHYATRVTDPQPGDLVFWGNPATHVGIYMGSGQVLDAPHTGARVSIRPIWGSPTYGRVPGVETSRPAALQLASGIVDKVKRGIRIVAGSVGDAAGVAAGAGAEALGLPSADELAATVRRITLEASAVALGLALVGVGIWKAVTLPAVKRTMEEVT